MKSVIKQFIRSVTLLPAELAKQVGARLFELEMNTIEGIFMRRGTGNGVEILLFSDWLVKASSKFLEKLNK